MELARSGRPGDAGEPGELRVLIRKQGQAWAEATRRTTGAAAARHAVAAGVGHRHGHEHEFGAIGFHPSAIGGCVDLSGELVATDNGDPTDPEAFPSPEHRAFNRLALAIVRPRAGAPGTIAVHA